MLGFEIEPLHDELVYGMLTRYRSMLGLGPSSRLVKLLLGDARSMSPVLAPQRLRDLAQRLPSGRLTADDFVSGHTGYPYFRRFLMEFYRKVLLTALREGSDMRSFRLSPGRPHRCLNFCRACVSDQDRMPGGPTWNRVHQAPGVFVCPEHGEVLLSSRIPTSQLRKLLSPRDAASPEPLAPPLARRDSARVADMTRSLMNDHMPIEAGYDAGVAIRSILQRRGWLDRRGTIHAHLAREHKKRFGGRALEQIGCNYDETKEVTWLHKLANPVDRGFDPARSVHPGPFIHPIKYILLFIFLDINISELLTPAKPPMLLN